MISAKNIRKERRIKQRRQEKLSDHIYCSLDTYFKDLDGHKANGLYSLMIAQVEKPMFEVVMHKTRGNITMAAEVLGINRGTLRNRLKKYNLE